MAGNTQFFTLKMSTGCMRKCYLREKRYFTLLFSSVPVFSTAKHTTLKTDFLSANNHT